MMMTIISLIIIYIYIFIIPFIISKIISHHNFGLECPTKVMSMQLSYILKALFMDTQLARFRWCARCQVPAPGTWIFRCQVLCVRWHERWASGVSLKRVIKMQLRNAYFRSLVHSSWKLWPKPNSDNSVPCILPCKIGGSWNLMRERYLSKTHLLIYQNVT